MFNQFLIDAIIEAIDGKISDLRKYENEHQNDLNNRAVYYAVCRDIDWLERVKKI
ncbi:hypothetical protein [Sporolactobacillus nakayamae]|uniref:Uncharacterized protein n=1 Tax=Sporolactobacillus nakayamae TaxID=269670 RepID=A0A1I2NDI4_9BACL|nr:hypothetical protein [Sporolactobacillus nakayamae]SFF99767.1 hypothetical protein SAMN02982927_00339 [Sporolactobacillus nakayamae]